jgi:hypothetical protein
MNGDRRVGLAGECFFIAPIGEEGSPVRERSDGLMECVVAPAAEALGMRAVRADRIARIGDVTAQVIDHVLRAKASVADLTGANPNVLYELALRHARGLPTVLIAEQGERLPSDVAQLRTVFFDGAGLNSVAACRDRITVLLRAALEDTANTPVPGPSIEVLCARAGVPMWEPRRGFVRAAPGCDYGRLHRGALSRAGLRRQQFAPLRRWPLPSRQPVTEHRHLARAVSQRSSSS